MPSLNDLRALLDDNDSTYAARFAGHPRATRDLDVMDDLIATAQQVMGEARIAMSGTAAQKADVVKQAERQLEIYRSERTLIAAAQKDANPAAALAAILGGRANAVFHRYARHFAGQSRASRDSTLLGDMVTELQRIHGAMKNLSVANPSLESVRDDMDVVQGRMQQFNDERREIAKAQTECAPEDAATALAGAANTLFAQYRSCFADQARVSRRPELLARIVEALTSIGDRMKALRAQGLHDAHNDGNIEVVAQRLGFYQTELAAIRQERHKAALPALEAELGGAANRDIDNYARYFAGQDRATRDLSRLTEMIDRLDELERQMTRIDESSGSADNAGNLKIVRDTLRMWAGEWDAISELESGRTRKS
ncbi:MAG: hypothetical protein FJ100_14730 [Deltaproteobacteria bacterium]|nr:hypothetical protein [Deltaproteobacteria bacterium]